MLQGNYQSFYFKKLHTLSSVMPVGLFLLVHLSANATAINSASQFNQVANFLESLPFLNEIEFVFIFLPLFYHAVYGLYVARISHFNTRQYGWLRNQLFVLQRITGFITFIFIVYHLWTARFIDNPPTYALMHGIISNPFGFWFMIIGTISAVFHFSNGLWSFLIHWGSTIGPRAQQISAYLSMILFIVLSFVGVRAILAF